MAGIYIHIPFCKTKCGYCDFYSCTQLELRDGVHDAIMAELSSERSFIGDVPIGTIYFGGGTPSLFQPARLQQIIDHIGQLWDCTGTGEITVEANPDDLTPDYLHRLAATAINRLSIGIQSFDDRHLRFMHRRHSAHTAVEAVRNAQRYGFDNISVDLIYGIPGMGVGEWRSALEKAIDLGVQHISAYHLTVEDGTPFGRLAASGSLTAVDEGVSESQFFMLHDTLTAAGFEHYEVSNFALPGLRARHNASYWRGEPYLGVGPSAHSFNGSVRRSSPPSVESYLGNRTHNYIVETLSGTDRYNEFIMTSLRTAEGVDERILEHEFGSELAGRFRTFAEPFLRSGSLVCDRGRWFIPADRFLVSDSVIAALFI